MQRKTLKALTIAAVTGSLSFLPSALVWAQVPAISVTTPGSFTIAEGAPNFTLTYGVTNNGAFPKILDIAVWNITAVGPDASDAVFFAGNGPQGPDGSQGFVSGDVIIPPGATGFYTLAFQVPKGSSNDADFGVNNLDFNIQMSDYHSGNNNTLTFTPQKGAISVSGPGGIIKDNPQTGVPNPSHSTMTVVDTPEPGVFALFFGLAVPSGLFLLRRRK